MTVFSTRKIVANAMGIVVAFLAAWFLVARLDLPRWLRERKVVHQVDVAAGRKVAGAAWRDGDLWVLTRAAGEGEAAGEVWEMARSDGWGVTREVYRLAGHPVPAVADGGAAAGSDAGVGR